MPFVRKGIENNIALNKIGHTQNDKYHSFLSYVESWEGKMTWRLDDMEKGDLKKKKGIREGEKREGPKGSKVCYMHIHICQNKAHYSL